MDKSPIGSIANTDDSFIRTLIVAMQQFLYEKVRVNQLENGVNTEIILPFHYSWNGEEQYMMDFFHSTDKYYEELNIEKIKGFPVPVPSGVVYITSYTINTAFLTSKYVRSNFRMRISTPFGDANKTISARAAMIPMSVSWEVVITSSSELQRFKLTENIIKKFYRTKKFKFTYGGFDSIPCTVGFPASYDLAKELKWKYPGVDTDLRPRITFQLETLTYMPSVDEETKRYVDNLMNPVIINKGATIQGPDIA